MVVVASTRRATGGYGSARRGGEHLSANTRRRARCLWRFSGGEDRGLSVAFVFCCLGRKHGWCHAYVRSGQALRHGEAGATIQTGSFGHGRRPGFDVAPALWNARIFSQPLCAWRACGRSTSCRSFAHSFPRGHGGDRSCIGSLVRCHYARGLPRWEQLGQSSRAHRATWAGYGRGGSRDRSGGGAMVVHQKTAQKA